MSKDELKNNPNAKSQKEPGEFKDGVKDKQENRLNICSKTPNSRIRWYFLLVVGPSLFAFLILHIYNSDQKYSTEKKDEIDYSTYREACLSGKFTSLKDLHRFVRQDIATMEGELSREDFLNTYYWKAKPVLMKGAAKEWPAFIRWTDDYLLNNFFDLRFYVDLRKHHSTNKAVRTKMNLGKFLTNYRKKEWYLDSMTGDDRFLDDLIVPNYLNVSGIFEFTEESDFYQNFYLSSGNTNSPLHYDGYANLLTVLDGRKEWIIAEPDASLQLQMDQWVDFPNLSPLNVTNFNISDHPGLCDVTWKRAVVEPGDSLFVPLQHPHHVYSPPGRNMALGMWFYLDAYNQLLEEAGYSEIDSRDVAESVRVYREHLESRPAPCDITDCSHLGPGTLRVHVSNQDTQYSRDSDVPPPASLPLKVYSNETVKIPGIAYGTGMPGGSIDNVYLNTRAALDLGYKLIDTAVMYGNEEEIGRAVKDCRWIRSSVKVITKFLWRKSQEEKLHSYTVSQIEGSLERLDLEYIDILLIHNTNDISSQDQLTVVWKAMESFVLSGKVVAIGLSNVELMDLIHVQSIASVPISLVQNFFSPFEYDQDVYAYCMDRKILLMGYGISGDYYLQSGYGSNMVLDDPLISDLARQYQTSKHAILYNWAAQKEIIVTTRSTSLRHMKENLFYLDVFLNEDHMNAIGKLLEVIYG